MTFKNISTKNFKEVRDILHGMLFPTKSGWELVKFSSVIWEVIEKILRSVEFEDEIFRDNWDIEVAAIFPNVS